jgi:hypothetical protein
MRERLDTSGDVFTYVVVARAKSVQPRVYPFPIPYPAGAIVGVPEKGATPVIGEK